MDESVILTGVDKLVALIDKKGKVSLKDAVRELKLSSEVVTEWAEFLEEEGIISIEYNFATPYFIKKKLSDADINSKEKQFNLTKDKIIRKAEGTLISIDMESSCIKKLKDEFEKLKKDIGGDLQHVKAEVGEFDKYSEFKRDLDKKMLGDKLKFKQMLDDIHKEVLQRKQEYSALITEMENEEGALKRQGASAKSLEESEAKLKAELDLIIAKATEASKNIDKKIDQAKDIEAASLKVAAYVTSVKQDIEKKRNALLKPLADQSNQYEAKIEEAQNRILGKIQKAKTGITDDEREGVKAAERFKAFFERKMKIEDLIKEIDAEVLDLTNDINMLIAKAKAFNAAGRGREFKGHAKDLEKKLAVIEKKKGIFDSSITKLASLVKK